jgi:transcription antitermination factor NusB
MNKIERRLGARTIARERALQALYQVDLAQADPADALRSAWEADDSGSQPDEATSEFAEALVRGVLARREDLDAMVERCSHHWRVERMARIDRNILRLGAYELTATPEIPANIILNEAIELAKRFGSEDSRAFINGILDRVASEAAGRPSPSDTSSK